MGEEKVEIAPPRIILPKDDCKSSIPQSVEMVANKVGEEKGDEVDIYKFKTIEAIAYYLQSEYGFEQFKRIYDKISVIDTKSKGKIFIQDYVEGLKEFLTAPQVDKHLVLFLGLSRMKSGQRA